MSGFIKTIYEVVGLGKVGSNRYDFSKLHSKLNLPFNLLTSIYSSHPVHPSTVHFPIAFLTAANVLNLIYGTALFFPLFSPFTVDKENMGTVTILGYFLNVLGIVTSIPAVVTGFAELYAMITSRGLFVEDKETGTKVIEPVVKVTLMHVSSISLQHL